MPLLACTRMQLTSWEKVTLTDNISKYQKYLNQRKMICSYEKFWKQIRSNISPWTYLDSKKLERWIMWWNSVLEKVCCFFQQPKSFNCQILSLEVGIHDFEYVFTVSSCLSAGGGWGWGLKTLNVGQKEGELQFLNF